ncbi:MAG TPA: M20/M25/M40 family metallo-hydrolase [Bacteroidales bacterium]|nr:M20/M25/M40 family metallo-hydrolase [Bacteroidales bacterium]
MKYSIIVTITVFLLLTSCAGARKHNEITHDELVVLTSYLASDQLAGRETGSPGDHLAELYIRKALRKAGLEPLNGDGIQRFEVPFSAEAGPANRLSVDGHVFESGVEFSPLALSSNDSLKSEVAFAGYGFMIQNDSMQWNDYAGTDMSGKWIMVLRGYPESNPKASDYQSFSSDRMKVLTAKDMGASGVLIVAGESWDSADKIDKPAKGESTSGIPVIQIKRSVADTILKSSGKTINELEASINSDLVAESFITGVTVDAETEVVVKNVSTANVVMKLPGTGLKNEYVIVGAHFDHLGMGGPGSSSRALDTIGIHHGADDNASGVALMIEIAEKLAADKKGHQRSIIFVAFTGEEMGLLGSKYFVENMGINPKDVNLMVNLDMVGRMKEGNNVQVGGVGTAAGLRDSVIAYTDTTLLSLSFTEEGYGPSDHSSFYGKEIPVLFITTGAHLDYHTPFDTSDKLNYAGIVRIGNLFTEVISAAANDSMRLAFREAGPMAPAQGMSRRRGITLGIMPDFAGNIKEGLRADFVTPGKPAAQGGMLKGDIIVAIDNKPVSNIQDYMFRLSHLKAGQIVPVEVIRNDKREVLLIQL